MEKTGQSFKSKAAKTGRSNMTGKSGALIDEKNKTGMTMKSGKSGKTIDAANKTTSSRMKQSDAMKGSQKNNQEE